MLSVWRLLESSMGCLGVLMKDEHPFCWTLEDPEKMLKVGKYRVIRKGNQIEIVDNAEPAFFTTGHTKEEADGNIILGFRVYSPRYITETHKALGEFQKVVKSLKEDVLLIRRI